MNRKYECCYLPSRCDSTIPVYTTDWYCFEWVNSQWFTISKHSSDLYGCISMFVKHSCATCRFILVVELLNKNFEFERFLVILKFLSRSNFYFIVIFFLGFRVAFDSVILIICFFRFEAKFKQYSHNLNQT